MSKIFRIKFTKIGDMIYISHLDLQRLLQRVFRRAGIKLSYSQGYNPHPKISYGNALALGTESYGEYVDIEIEDESLEEGELLKRINSILPQGLEFIKCRQLNQGERALAANIEYGDYVFIIENKNGMNKFEVDERIGKLLDKKEIYVEKLNKKKKLVEVDIRPLISKLSALEVDDETIKISALIATGSKQNLNTNLFIPILLDALAIQMDHLDVDIIRNDLYFKLMDELVSPM